MKIKSIGLFFRLGILLVGGRVKSEPVRSVVIPAWMPESKCQACPRPRAGGRQFATAAGVGPVAETPNRQPGLDPESRVFNWPGATRRNSVRPGKCRGPSFRAVEE